MKTLYVCSCCEKEFFYPELCEAHEKSCKKRSIVKHARISNKAAVLLEEYAVAYSRWYNQLYTISSEREQNRVGTVTKVHVYIADLEERLRWKNITTDGLPDFEREIVMIMTDGNKTYKTFGWFSDKVIDRYGGARFYDARSGNIFVIEELPKVCRWRYSEAEEQK